MFWSRKPTPPPPVDRAKPAGLDLTAARAVAACLVAGQPRPIPLGGDVPDLPMVLALDRRPPAVGWDGVRLVRLTPHLAYPGFLGHLGRPSDGKRPAAEVGLTAAFDRLRGPLNRDTDACVLALPAYLTAEQAEAAVRSAARLPLVGAASAPLVLAARHANLLTTDGPLALPPADGVVRFRPPAPAGPGWGVVLDADDFALSAAVVTVSDGGAVQLASAHWPRLSLPNWADRFIDALSDRCVRLCRRDPRDSATAEQAVFEQLPAVLGALHGRQPTVVRVRADRWYQDIHLTPDEVAGWCDPLARTAADGTAELARSADRPFPPRAVWLTHAAAQLPGLMPALTAAFPAQTAVLGLHPWAVCEAAAALATRWQANQLPRAYLDAVIPAPTAAAIPTLTVSG